MRPGAEDPHWLTASVLPQYKLKLARRAAEHDEPEFWGSMNHTVGVLVSPISLLHPVGSRTQQNSRGKPCDVIYEKRSGCE